VAKYRGVIDPRDILIEIAAVWVYAKEHPERVKHATHLRHLLGAKLLTLGSRVRELWEPNGKAITPATGKDYREAGRVILVQIGELLKTIHEGVVARREMVEHKVNVQKQPFTS